MFGMGPIAMAQTRERHRRAFAAQLSEAVDAEVVVVVASTYEELSGLAARAETHVAWLPPAVFVASFDRGEAQLLVRAVRAHGSRFRGALFVRSEMPWQSASDLRGLRVAWVDRGSCAGYLFPRLALADARIDPDSHFDQQFLLGSHNAVARAVEVGKADVGATFIDHTPHGNGKSQIQRPGWALEVDPEDMRAVLVSEPIPADTISATPALAPEDAARLSEVLTVMHETPEGAAALKGLFGVDRFEPGELERYEPVRRALSGRRAAG